jgi:hypothetical protein
MYNQRVKRVLILRSLPLPEVEKGGEELSLQFQLINPLLPLSLTKLRRNQTLTVKQIRPKKP